MRVLINDHGSDTFTLDIQRELTFSLGYLRAHTEPCSQRSSNSLNEGPVLSAKQAPQPGTLLASRYESSFQSLRLRAIEVPQNDSSSAGERGRTEEERVRKKRAEWP